MRRLHLVLVTLCIAGCVDFQQSGRNLGSGLSEGIMQNADTVGSRLGAGLVKGLRDTLTSMETRRRLADMVDDIGIAFAKQAAASRDTLLGEYTKAWLDSLKTVLIGSATRRQLGELRDELLGKQTTGFLRDSLSSVSASLRDALLGAGTQAAVDSIIASAIATLSQQYREKMQPVVHEEAGFVQRHASMLLWLAGGVVAAVLVVAGVVFMRRKKDSALLGVLTNQIHAMPGQDAYDELVSRIRARAKESGVEPRLRAILRDHGILGETSWSSATSTRGEPR